MELSDKAKGWPYVGGRHVLFPPVLSPCPGGRRVLFPPVLTHVLVGDMCCFRLFCPHVLVALVQLTFTNNQ
ncbi:hypothetical protein ACOMHN_023307 [Nucella lapillus]